MADPTAAILELWTQAVAEATGQDCPTEWRAVNRSEAQAGRILWWRQDFGAAGAVYTGCESELWTTFLQRGEKGESEAESESGTGNSLEDLVRETADRFAAVFSTQAGSPLGEVDMERWTDDIPHEVFAVTLTLPGARDAIDFFVSFDPALLHSPGTCPNDSRLPGPIGGLQVYLRARLSRAGMPLNELLRLRPGSVIRLGAAGPDPVELTVEGRLVARGRISRSDGKVRVIVTAVGAASGEGRWAC
jgi:flagellar motor switch/type III secretory pathway protein FliN